MSKSATIWPHATIFKTTKFCSAGAPERQLASTRTGVSTVQGTAAVQDDRRRKQQEPSKDTATSGLVQSGSETYRSLSLLLVGSPCCSDSGSASALGFGLCLGRSTCQRSRSVRYFYSRTAGERQERLLSTATRTCLSSFFLRAGTRGDLRIPRTKKTNEAN